MAAAGGRYKFDWFTRDWFGGTRQLDFAERGLYADLLSLIYERAGRLVLPTEQDMCRILACDPRVYRRLLGRLISAGKIEVFGGVMTNPRATRQIAGDNQSQTSGRLLQEVSKKFRESSSKVEWESQSFQWHFRPLSLSPSISIQEEDSSPPLRILTAAHEKITEPSGAGEADAGAQPAAGGGQPPPPVQPPGRRLKAAVQPAGAVTAAEMLAALRPVLARAVAAEFNRDDPAHVAAWLSRGIPAAVIIAAVREATKLATEPIRSWAYLKTAVERAAKSRTEHAEASEAERGRGEERVRAVVERLRAEFK